MKMKLSCLGILLLGVPFQAFGYHDDGCIEKFLNFTFCEAHTADGHGGGLWLSHNMKIQNPKSTVTCLEANKQILTAQIEIRPDTNGIAVADGQSGRLSLNFMTQTYEISRMRKNTSSDNTTVETPF